jgi:hypothetical protein
MKIPPLYKKYVFWPFLVLIVAILTAINNHFFYVTKQKTLESEQRNLIKISDAILKNCLSERIKWCDSELKYILSLSRLPGEVALKRPDGSLLLVIDNELYKDDRTSVSSSEVIGSGNYKLTVSFSRLSSPPLIKSVFRSMTFSIVDIFDKLLEDPDEVPDFIWDVAIPRSQPAFFYFLAVGSVLFLISRKQKALYRDLISAQGDLSKVILQRDSALEQRNDLSRKQEDIQLQMTAAHTHRLDLIKQLNTEKEKSLY